MEVNRLSRENPGTFVLDGVVSVIDVENWEGYTDTSVTAKMQAKYTDLIVYNKWEVAGEERLETCRDRVGDLEEQIAWVKSVGGWVDVEVVMGIDGGLVRKQGPREAVEFDLENAVEGEREVRDGLGQGGEHDGHDHHQSEVEVLSLSLFDDAEESATRGRGEPGGEASSGGLDIDSFETLLLSCPKDEIYRIKGLILSATPPPDSTGDRRPSLIQGKELYVLNWAFGRWTYTTLPHQDASVMDGAVVRLTFILAVGEANKWIKKLEKGDLVELQGRSGKGKLVVDKIG